LIFPFSAVVALNTLEENKRVHEKVNTLNDLSQPHGTFWTSGSKAAVVAMFHDRVEQVHGFYLISAVQAWP
jgi:hypothetical protein